MVHRSYDFKKLHEIAHGDQDFVQDLMITFVENVSDDIEKIQSLRLLENWKAIAEIAHRLASRFAYLNIDSMQDLSTDIERSVLIHNNLTGIADKVDRLCNETILLLEQLKKDFEFLCKLK